MLVKLGLLFNGIVGAILAVPIVRYLLSPVTRGRRPGYESGSRSADSTVSGGPDASRDLSESQCRIHGTAQTADIPCWVRNVDGQNFQVFAINCAHLGCPVRWFPQSNLFMCPCHGGVY